MRLEHIPLIIGAIVALIGLGFIADAVMAESPLSTPERRRRIRAERHRAGEAIVGVGVVCIAASLLGRDTWRYGTLAVMIGAAMMLIGIMFNRTFLKETLFFRGPARRADPSDAPRTKPAARVKTKAPAAPPPVMGRNRPAEAAKAPASSPPPSSRPGPAVPPRTPMTAAATPATPMRAVEAPQPKPAANGPVGKVERRKTPRGKK